MGREIRRVPADWVHPFKYGREEYQPMLQGYEPYLIDWENEQKNLAQNMKTLIEGGEIKAYGEIVTDPETYWLLHFEYGLDFPRPSEYMPIGDWYQLYQTVSEGTPLSPPFETEKELKDYLATKGDFWSSEPWAEQAIDNLFSRGFSMSATVVNEPINPDA